MRGNGVLVRFMIMVQGSIVQQSHDGSQKTHLVTIPIKLECLLILLCGIALSQSQILVGCVQTARRMKLMMVAPCNLP